MLEGLNFKRSEETTKRQHRDTGGYIFTTSKLIDSYSLLFLSVCSHQKSSRLCGWPIIEPLSLLYMLILHMGQTYSIMFITQLSRQHVERRAADTIKYTPNVHERGRLAARQTQWTHGATPFVLPNRYCNNPIGKDVILSVQQLHISADGLLINHLYFP